MVSVKTNGDGDLIARIEQLAGQVAARFGADDEAEQEWLASQCPPELSEVVTGLSVQSLHLLDQVHEAGSTNVVGLARRTGVPKGTVSKSLQRLDAAGLIHREHRPGNRKEVWLTLTPAGEQVQQAHRSLHEQMGSGLSEFLGRYCADDLAVIARVLDDLVRMPREGLRFRPDLLDE